MFSLSFLVLAGSARGSSGNQIPSSLASLLEAMDPDRARDNLWITPKRALQALVWAGVLVLPEICRRGHEWSLGAGGMQCFHKVSWLGDDGDELFGQCNLKKTWRRPGSLPFFLPSNVKPDSFLKGVYYFAEDATPQTAIKYSGLKGKAFGSLATHLRMMCHAAIQKLMTKEDMPNLGGKPHLAVCIDETYFTRKKIARGGFQGRYSVGHKTIVLGMVELNLMTRKTTGNVRLLVIPRTTKAMMQKMIKTHVCEGSLIFTDSLGSYKWLGKPDSGYVHRHINHKKREFSRVETLFGQQVNVSTNAAEGLFGRVKQWARKKGIKKISRKAYGELMSEFVWRQTFTGSRTENSSSPIWPFLHLISEWQEEPGDFDGRAYRLESIIDREFDEFYLSTLSDPVEDPPLPAQDPGVVWEPLQPEAVQPSGVRKRRVPLSQEPRPPAERRRRGPMEAAPWYTGSQEANPEQETDEIGNDGPGPRRLGGFVTRSRNAILARLRGESLRLPQSVPYRFEDDGAQPPQKITAFRKSLGRPQPGRITLDLDTTSDSDVQLSVPPEETEEERSKRLYPGARMLD